MTVSRNVVVRKHGRDALRGFVTLGELSEFVSAAYEAGAQPTDMMRLSGLLEIEIPSAEERAERAQRGLL